MKRLGFRARLFLILVAFAVVPAVAITLAWGGMVSEVVPLVGAGAAWDSVARSGERVIAAVERAPLDSAQRAAVRDHERVLRESLLQARRVRYLASQTTNVVALVAFFGVLVFAAVASRVAGHLSRQLSRPIDELVGWTERLGRGQALPEGERRGAPEFAVLRRRMRSLARELARGRERAVEAERAAAFRETARQVAHELKNPLTPIRFAVDRLRREVPPPLGETVEVLSVETQRLEEMARSFSQFGRLPEGPRAEVDLGDLARATARSTVADRVPLRVEVAEGLPMVRGHYDALSRALANVLLNAVDACQDRGEITVRVGPAPDADGVAVSVEDTGCGIPAERLERIWDPYVTFKQGGTGLGLAIVRQTVLAHGGDVEAASEPGRGTTIRFVLPADPAPEGAEHVARA
ncbi:MAG TPA: HAMP domain-containing sensor histidine kinase [Gemmatimonadaceae bacterium]|nr:HAMP domain-containing sensor histidine kinase [Gemmatimonadaceae bacterium]